MKRGFVRGNRASPEPVRGSPAARPRIRIGNRSMAVALHQERTGDAGPGEAGLMGQVLYLDAEAAGVRATGIGAYFDDEVHETFGLAGHRFQSVYHFTIGGPVEDVRLQTISPYGKEARARPGDVP